MAGAIFLLAAVTAFAQQPSADRLVAERVLRLGGAVMLEGQHVPIHDLDDLPDADFQIHMLDLVGVSMGAWGLKDELSRLPPLPHLKELYLNGRLWYNQPMSLVADTIGLFSASTELEKLVLSKPVQTYIPLEDPVLERLAPVASLTELRLHQTKLPGAALAPFTRLRYLDLSHNRFFDDRGLRHVGRMTALDKLYLTGTSITDEGLRNLAGLTQLSELALDGTGISDAGLAHLAGLTNLRRLDLLGSNVTDGGLVHLQRMTRLEELNLYRTKVSNAGLARLATLDHLRSLDVRYSRVTPSGVKELMARIPNVSVLADDASAPTARRSIDVASVEGRGEEAIAKWLESIGGHVTRRDARLVGVSLGSSPITDREVAILRELPQLEELSLRNTEISDLGLAQLSALRSLRALDVSHTLLADSALAALAPLTNLQVLDLSHTLVDGTGLGALAGLRSLREIALANTPLRDEALEHLGKLSTLEKVSLQYTDITDEATVHFPDLQS